MNLARIILALLTVSCGASFVYAQVGGICQVGQYCPPNPGQGPGNGGVDPSPYDPQPGHPHGPPPHQPPQQQPDHRVVNLGQYYRDQDINLLSLFNLNPYNSQGAEILSVEVVLQDNGRSTLSLMADGYTVASSGYLNPYTTLLPNQRLVLGQSVRSFLNLAVRGKLFIQSIAINLRQSYQPPPPPPGQNQVVLQGSVYQNFMQPGNVDIARITGLMSYRGYQISSVTVNGHAISNNQLPTRLMINGMIEGQLYFGNQESGQMVYPRRSYVVGNNLNSITLLVDGGVAISTIQVRLVRF